MNYLQTLQDYEALCDHADSIATAYILATAEDTGRVEQSYFTFDFPCVYADDDGNPYVKDDATYEVSWTETWAHGGYEDHRHHIPFRLLLMDKLEALAEIEALAQARAKARAEREQAEDERAEAKRREVYLRLRAEFGEGQDEPATG